VLELYQLIHIAGPNIGSTEPTFGVIDLLVVADLYNTLVQYGKAVHHLMKAWSDCKGGESRNGEMLWRMRRNLTLTMVGER
jgi:hypothetical protein